jgi:hypothetical protein
LPPFSLKLFPSRLLSKNIKTRIYKTIILLVVLYGCGTWSLTLREEQRLRVFKNRVSRRIFGSKRDGSGGRLKKPMGRRGIYIGYWCESQKKETTRKTKTYVGG